ncbi:MAG: hypothetical protein V4808_09535 [Pseudomonadota bacterium]
MKRTVAVAMASVVAAGLVGATEPPAGELWTGEVQPGSGWLKRQGLEASYPISFTVDADGRGTGTIQFSSVYPVTAGKAALKGERDADGSAFYLFSTIESRHGAPAQAEAKITLTGFDEEDGSLRGVGIIDMADLACVTDPVRSVAKAPCARRMVPVKWTAKK